MKNSKEVKFYKTLEFKLLKLVIVAFLIAIIFDLYFLRVFGWMAIGQIENINNATQKEILFINFVVIMIFILAVAIFVAVFLFGVSRRVKYIRYISNELLDIKNNRYLEKLEVRGDDDISRLAQSINIMSERLKKNYENEKMLEEEKNQMIIALSHDLKSPLTSIIGYLDVAKNKDYDEKNDYIDIAYKKSLELKRLIFDMFDYIKLEDKKFELQKTCINMSLFINQFVGEYEPLFIKQGIEIEMISRQDDILVNIDPEQYVRVLENIFSNVKKYGDCNSKFVIDISKTQQGYTLKFINNAKTIEKSDMKKIFQRMYRVDKSRGKVEGAGLGLATVKKIVELHEHKISASSYNDKFEVRIEL